jgi:hypothetical protein
MKSQESDVVVAVSMAFLLTATAYSFDAPGFSTVKRHSTSVQVFGVDAKEQLAMVLVGSGIEGIYPATPSLTRSGGTVFWKMTRDNVDDEGMRHRFYRQYYVPPPDPANAISEEVSNGAWMVGAEVGLHYDGNGLLVFAFGTQFEDVGSTNVPSIDTAAEARIVARDAVLDGTGFTPREAQDLTSATPGAQLSRTELLLHNSGERDSFDFVWEAPITDVSGVEKVATINAQSGTLIALEDRTVWSVCAPNSNDQDSAVGVPQNPSISDRSVWATETDDRGATFSHEAHKISSGSNPDIQVFYGLDDDPCSDSGVQDYSLMPVKTISGSPMYDDYTSPDSVPGTIGADAIYFTYKTMATFNAFGRDGWDDDGSVAKVVVDAICPSGKEDNAMFAYSGTYDYVPTPGVAICPADAEDFSPAAAIDIVAHEWGHGVIFTSAGWSYSGDGKIYHEGFADIIGHAVEWYNQSPGSGDERAEWKFGEDRDASQATWWRRADDDDGLGGHSYHADDPPGSASDPYQNGLPLSVAQYLMSEGGYNPVCDRLDELDGCDVEVEEIGATAASRILFKALTTYATSSSDWEDFGPLAKVAAYFLYKSCPGDNAATEQQTALDAFEAIGYGGNSCCLPCLP